MAKSSNGRMRVRCSPAISATAKQSDHEARTSTGDWRVRSWEQFLQNGGCESDDNSSEAAAPLSPATVYLHHDEKRIAVNDRVGSGRRGQRDGEIRSATVNRPFSVCAVRDGRGTLAFTDMHNNAVRFVVQRESSGELLSSARVVQTLANTELLTPKGICASEDGRYLFVCDTGHHKIKFASLPARSALVSAEEILAGVEMFPFAGNGKKDWRDGPVLECSFNSPTDVWQRADGTIVIADTGNHCIRQILRTTKGTLVTRTIAGGYASYKVRGQERIGADITHLDDFARFNKRNAGHRDGRHALFRSPSGITEGTYGELLVADTMNNCIRGLLPSSDGKLPWETKTVCGVVGGGYTDGSCEIAAFSQPMSLCLGPHGTFFVSDRGNGCIRQVGGCHAEFSGDKRDSLAYSWVRTIEIGVVPQSVFEASAVTMGECAVDRLGYPLGVLFLEGGGKMSEEGARLVICDGGNNVIEFLSFDTNVNGIVGATHLPRGLPDLSPQRKRSTMSSPHERWAAGAGDNNLNASALGIRPTRRISSHSPTAHVVPLDEKEEACSSNQQCEQQFECTCGSSSTWNKLCAANAALQSENARLKELLHQTFEEVRLLWHSSACIEWMAYAVRDDNVQIEYVHGAFEHVSPLPRGRRSTFSGKPGQR